ncbi:MAG: hypothetical protein LBD75_05295 [Candidatus Peribacteria bacterium]|nr:hypothetical protein [Candidatus Peribacteria bacterium]
MKVYAQWGGQLVHILFRGKGGLSESLPNKMSVIGKVKRDTFNGGWYIEGEEMM